MKRGFAVLSLGIAAVLCLYGFSACGEGKDTFSSRTKIGVITGDSQDAETVSARRYLDEYIYPNYPVEFVYATDVDSYISEYEELRALVEDEEVAGILSLTNFSSAAALEYCEGQEVYYARAFAGAFTQAAKAANGDSIVNCISAAQYDGYTFNAGSVGLVTNSSVPSETTYYQTGYEAIGYFLTAGAGHFLLYCPPYANNSIDLNIVSQQYTFDGMLARMSAAGVRSVVSGSEIEMTVSSSAASQGISSAAAVIGYSTDSSVAEKLATAADNIEETIAAWGGSAAALSTSQVAETLADGLFTNASVAIGGKGYMNETYASLAAEGKLSYCYTYFGASVAPAFVCLYNAINGYVMRTEDGAAVNVATGYWTATSAEEFLEQYELDRNVQTPAVTADEMAAYIKSYTAADGTEYAYSDSVDVAQFLAFAADYGYSSRKK